MAFRSRGLPSRGCNKCRAKKIRCDEAKPICQNCIRVAYTECKYRDEFERTWRVHTEKSIEKTAEKLNKQPTSPACPIMSRFFFDWTSGVSADRGVSISWLDALPAMYTKAEQGGLLHYSIQALAHVNHGKRFGNSESVKKGSEYYGEALRKMREVISSNDDKSVRDILASTVLLGIHEAFVDPLISPSGSWLSHISGASVFMNKQFESRTARDTPIDLQIRSMIFRQTLHGSFLSGRSPTISLDQDHTLQDPQLKPIKAHNSLFYQATVLCSEWRAAFGSMHALDGSERLVDIAGRAILLDEELGQWGQNLPRPFGYSAKPIDVTEALPEWLRDLLTPPGAPRFYHEPESPVSEMLWRFYWEIRMILCQALLYTNSVLRSRASPYNPINGREEDIESCLLNSIDRLCESCVTPLIKGLGKTSEGGFEPKDIPSIRGYLMLQILPTVYLCLEQIVPCNRHVDLGSRRAWVNAMKDFAQYSLGFTKAEAVIDTAHLKSLPIQLWSFACES